MASFTAGSSVSAGVSASAGAFSGLRVETARTVVDLDPQRLLPRAEVTWATGREASFQLGGRAVVEGSASLRTDVGATASVTGRIRFEEK